MYLSDLPSPFNRGQVGITKKKWLLLNFLNLNFPGWDKVYKSKHSSKSSSTDFQRKSSRRAKNNTRHYKKAAYKVAAVTDFFQTCFEQLISQDIKYVACF